MPRSVPRPLRCLIVENHKTLRAALEEVLSAAGFDVVGATGSPREALTKHFELTPDVVILDQRLGATTGTALAADMRSAEPLSTFVLYTSHADSQTSGAARLAGISDVVQKEASPENLLRCLARIQAARRT
jgi:DNA-binding NarL/FixJ family response regulator